MKLDMKYIPLDKSWVIRMGVLDMVNGQDDIVSFLKKQNDLGDDLVALKNAAAQWKRSKSIDVGESGTLYRFLQFASWKLGLDKKFIKHGTLQQRDMVQDPRITGWSLEKLLKLDNGTSQWASASVLLGNKQKIKSLPYKLKVTQEALKHWHEMSKKKQSWLPRYDETIQKQAEAFLKMRAGQKPTFKPQQAEDFCFAYTFGYISREKAAKKWPSLRGHESDRIVEMQEMLNKAKLRNMVDSKDHRVVQAIAMWAMFNHKTVRFKYPKSVNKSWPQFWKFLKVVSKGVQ